MLPLDFNDNLAIQSCRWMGMLEGQNEPLVLQVQEQTLEVGTNAKISRERKSTTIGVTNLPHTPTAKSGPPSSTP